MTLKKFEKEFLTIKNMGWIKTKFIKNKNGGAGNTLEKLLDIKENNLTTPDLGQIELKTTKKTSSGTITLFTYDRAIWTMKQKDVLEKYGKWIKEKERFDLYYIHTPKKPTSNNIKTLISSNSLQLFSYDNVKIMDYSFEKMAERWNQKLKESIIVNFKERKNFENIREYKFYKFRYHVGKMTKEIMKRVWEDNLVVMETSMHLIPNKAVRNHGTKIRAKQNDIEKIYKLLCKIK